MKRSSSSKPARPLEKWGRSGVWVVIAVAALVVAGPSILPGRTPIPMDLAASFAPWRGELPPPTNPGLGDPFQQLTTAAYSAEALKSGHLPLLNPHVLSGHPVAGDSIAAAFNPLQLVLRAVLSLHAALGAQVYLQLLVAGLAMAWWVETVTASRRAGALAGVAWVMAGYQQVWLAYVYHLASLMWIPVVAVCWEKAARKRGWAWAAAGGVAAGLAAHGGQVQIGLYAAFVALAYAAGAILVLGVPRRSGVAAGIAIGVIGALIAAPTLLPALAQASETVRVGFSAEALRMTALPLSHALTALAPWLFGDPVRGDYAGEFNTNEFMIYAGLAPLVLALVGPFARRDRLGWVAALMCGLVALITLGWIGTSIQAGLPLVRYFGVGRWVAVWPMAVAFAAGVAVAGAEANDAVARRLRLGAACAASGLAAVLVVGGWWIVDSGVRDALSGATTVASTLWGGDLPWFDLLQPLLALLVTAGAIVWWSGQTHSRARFGVLLLVVMLDLGSFAARYSPAGRVDGVPVLAPLGEVAREAARDGVRVAPESGDAIVLGPGVAPLVGLDTIDGYSSALQGGYARFVKALSEPSGNGFLDSNPNVVAVGRVSPVLAKLLNVGWILRVGERAPLSVVAWEGLGCGDGPGSAAGWWRLEGSRIARVAFRPSTDGLHRVDIQARPGSGQGSDAVLTVIDDSGAEIARQDVHLDAAGAVGRGPGSAIPVTMYFVRQVASAGRAFTATLVAQTPVEVCVDDRGRLALTAHAVEEPLELAYEGADVTAYRVTDRLGGAWSGTRVVAAPDQDAALELVSARGFDPARVVVLEAADWGASSASEEEPSRTHLPVSRPDSTTILVEVAPGSGRWVAVSQAYAPGWVATVDGAPVPVWRAYGGIMAVPVASGAAEVRLSYAPPGLRTGLALAVVGLSIAFGLARVALIRRQGSPSPRG